MTLTELLGHPLFWGDIWALATTYNNNTLDAEGEKAAYVFPAPVADTLLAIQIKTSTITTGGTLSVRVETVDPATGFPTGNLYHADATTTLVIGSANDGVVLQSNDFNSGDGFPIANKDDWLAVVLVVGVDGFSGSIATGAGFSYVHIPSTVIYNTGAWVKANYPPQIGLQMANSGTPKFYVPNGCSVPAEYNTTTWNNSANPDRRGGKFRLPANTRVVWLALYGYQNVDADVILYDYDAHTVLSTVFMDKDYSNAGAGAKFYTFPTPVDLVKDQYYRVVFLPKSTTNVQLAYRDLLVDGACNPVEACFRGSYGFIYTTCNGAPTQESDWTDDPDRLASMVLGVSHIDFGGAVGGGPIIGSAIHRGVIL
jgi:hypothetical protein